MSKMKRLFQCLIEIYLVLQTMRVVDVFGFVWLPDLPGTQARIHHLMALVKFQGEYRKDMKVRKEATLMIG